MRHVTFAVTLLLCVGSLEAQSRAGIIVDVEGVHRQPIDPVPGPVRYEPGFDSGGGIGVGIRWHLSDRFALEGKVAGLGSEGRLRIVGPDFIANGNLGFVQIYPIMLVAQYHPFEQGAIRPYAGLGLAHVILRNIEQTNVTPAIEFDDPTGIILNAGLRVPISNKWSFNADARYIPVESQGSVRFLGPAETRADIDVRPLVVGLGVVYHY